jgi:glycosyltransferase involved in cell wall biosynthesis
MNLTTIQNATPLVSVLMTAYNRELYIADAIQSVMNSTFQDFELIIVDDCSTDRTVEIARSYEVLDNRIKLYINEQNLGDYPNRNKAASFARGQFLISVDSDDKLYENSLKYIVDGFDLYPEANFGIIDSNINDLNLVKKQYEIKKPEEVIKEHFFKRPTLMRGPGGSVIRRGFFNNIKGFPTLYGPANDMFYNLRASSNSQTLFFGYHFLFYRIHENQERNNEKSYVVNNFKYLKDYILFTDTILTSKQKKIILKNNSRRFVINTLKYLVKHKSFSEFFSFFKKVSFSSEDFRSIF